MRVSLVDVLMFVAEMGVYTAVAGAAWAWAPDGAPTVLGVVVVAGAVLMMALWWGLLHSPKATVHLPRAVDVPLRVAWFGVGLLAAVTTAGR